MDSWTNDPLHMRVFDELENSNGREEFILGNGPGFT
jgi:hypothetical protein